MRTGILVCLPAGVLATAMLAANAAERATSHWAYVRPEVAEPAGVIGAAGNGWCRNAIDTYVWSELERRGLAPSPPANKRTLIRRVTFDLTGLPPTREEVAAFLQDESGQAYERVVDRLLHSKRYGERMAAWWLDLARYADTHGYEGDGPRTIWLYRDWVIDAFNRGLPFHHFTVEQLAGDLIPDATDTQRIATGFHRNSPFCFEAGTDLEQFRVESVVDRVNTTMTVFMGTTMGCAQCHEHKYDPFEQREYYELYAFFNNSAEASAEGATVTTTSPLAREQVAELTSRLADIERVLAEQTPELDAAQREWEATLVDAKWQVVVPERVVSRGGATLTRLEDDSVLAGGENPPHDAYELETTWQGGTISAIALEVIRDKRLPHGGPGRYESNGNFAVSDLKLSYQAAGGERWEEIDLVRAVATYEESNDVAANAIDDDAVSSWCTNQNAGHAVFEAAARIDLPKGTTVRIKLRHDSQYERHGVGRFRLWTVGDLEDGLQQDDLVPPRIASLASTAREQRAETEADELSEFFRRRTPLLSEARQARDAVQDQMAPSTTLVMVERDEPRETRMLIRGSFLDPGEIVEPGVPSVWHAWPEGAARDRLGLARWLTDPANPLIGRVTMNRVWGLMFGKGIVKTSEDFGSQGAPPTHPGLLDYLARRFVDGGWNLKAMQKEIVMSATYRQSSRVTPELLRIDPNNDYFARGPAFRLDAEMIRDNALAISGLMTHRLGGPGVYPHQPTGVYEQIHSYTTAWETSTGGDQFRRGLYTWWKRTAPYPSMITFDAPRRNVCVERRPRSNTPLQALVTLNDPVFVQAAAALGRRMATEVTGDAATRIRYGFELCVARRPATRELERLVRLFERNAAIFRDNPEAASEVASGGLPFAAPAGTDTAELAAWTLVGSALLNLDETLTKY